MERMKMRYLYRSEQREKWISLDGIYKLIKTENYGKRVSAVRQETLVSGHGTSADGEEAASLLPVINPEVGEYGYTGYVLLSLRTTDGMERLEQLRRRVNQFPQTVLSFVGSSGQSLKVIMSYALLDGSLPRTERSVCQFRQMATNRASDFLFASTGVRPEIASEVGESHFRISSDPSAYLNPAPVPILMEQPTGEMDDYDLKSQQPMEANPLAKEVLPGYSALEMSLTKFNFICRRLSFDQHLEEPEYLLRLADECHAAGVDQEIAAKSILHLEDFRGKDTLVRSCMENAYSRHRYGKSHPIDRNVMYQQLLHEFLNRRYMFRRNTITGDVEYQEKDRYLLSWHPLTREARNDINSAALQEGIKVWDKDLDRIINSERIYEYDPVKEWIDRLPTWDGRDRVGELAARVTTRMEDWTTNFRIWMRSMVSQWMKVNRRYGAQMVLMLIGGQGTRKSTFMRMLLPEQLSQFYIDRIDFTNKKEALRALGRFLLISIDEYDQISKTQMAYFKHLIQRTDVVERKMYETTYQQSQRYAAFAATTNSLTPLMDDTGNRRYLCVEVTDVIDTDVTGDKAIDYSQLYAQIVEEIRNGEEYYFDGERERSIILQNAEYDDQPTVISIFEDQFRKPRKGDETLYLSPTEILAALKMKYKSLNISHSAVTVLGSYLRRKGYEKGGACNRRCYAVAKNGER